MGGAGPPAGDGEGGGVEVLPEAGGVGEERLQAGALRPLAAGVGEVEALRAAEAQAGEDDGPLRLEQRGGEGLGIGRLWGHRPGRVYSAVGG